MENFWRAKGKLLYIGEGLQVQRRFWKKLMWYEFCHLSCTSTIFSLNVSWDQQNFMVAPIDTQEMPLHKLGRTLGPWGPHIKLIEYIEFLKVQGEVLNEKQVRISCCVSLMICWYTHFAGKLTSYSWQDNLSSHQQREALFDEEGKFWTEIPLRVLLLV
jgi:hypothetical protein